MRAHTKEVHGKEVHALFWRGVVVWLRVRCALLMKEALDSSGFLGFLTLLRLSSDWVPEQPLVSRSRSIWCDWFMS
jgi:hypothetical protein